MGKFTGNYTKKELPEAVLFSSLSKNLASGEVLLV